MTSTRATSVKLEEMNVKVVLKRMRSEDMEIITTVFEGFPLRSSRRTGVVHEGAHGIKGGCLVLRWELLLHVHVLNDPAEKIK